MNLKCTTLESGTGIFKLNNAYLNTSTKLYIDISSNNKSQKIITSTMSTIDSVTSDVKGFVKLSKKTDSSKFIIFQITDIVDNTGWYTYISHQSSSSIVPFQLTTMIFC